jgi:hypothetical protein
VRQAREAQPSVNRRPSEPRPRLQGRDAFAWRHAGGLEVGSELFKAQRLAQPVEVAAEQHVDEPPGNVVQKRSRRPAPRGEAQDLAQLGGKIARLGHYKRTL